MNSTDNRIYVGKSGLNYTESSLFFFERKFFDDAYVESKREFMSESWHVSIYYALAYCVLIFAGQWYMRSRPKFDLRRPLVAWSLLLAIFSIIGTIRVWPEFISAVYTKGITHTMCSSDYAHGVTGAWSWFFIMSKLPELGDTIFIVLRKQELIFLHWYHHATVLVYCWFSGRDFAASGRWFSLMNYTVHSVMYSYYALRALRFKIPKWVNITITSGQILQMIVGIYINCVAYYRKSTGQPCDVSDENIKWASIMYLSYFVLFFHFFYQTYVSKPKQLKQQQSEQQKEKLNGSNGVAKNGDAVQNGKNGHHYTNGVNNGHHQLNGDVKKRL